MEKGGISMYGTIGKMKIKPGEEENVRLILSQWENEEKGTIDGVVCTYFMVPDNSPGEMIGVAVFRDKDAYLANGNSPEQHERFMKLRVLLSDDPEWTDGEYLSL